MIYDINLLTSYLRRFMAFVTSLCDFIQLEDNIFYIETEPMPGFFLTA